MQVGNPITIIPHNGGKNIHAAINAKNPKRYIQFQPEIDIKTNKQTIIIVPIRTPSSMIDIFGCVFC